MNLTYSGNAYESHQRLIRLIENKVSELKEYVKRPNANDYFINKTNEEIQELVDIANNIKPLKRQDIWQFVEAQIILDYEKDPNLSGFQLLLKEFPKKNNFSLISLDLTLSNEFRI